MNFKFYVLILFFVPFCVFKLSAQEVETQNSLFLRDYLTKIETKFNVKFSFSDEVLKDKYLRNELAINGLQETLRAISQQTGLEFQIIDSRYIVISDGEEYTGEGVCGYVYDAKTKKPIYGANVLVLSKKRGVSSNSNGFFRLKEIKETDVIEVSFVGYEKKLIDYEKFKEAGACLSVEISQQDTVLKEILISDYLSGGIAKQSDGSIVISPQKLGSISGLAEPDVLQTIQLLPGISSPTETAADLFIRGGTPEQNLILFDGIKMYNSSHLFGMISAFNPYVINEVKIFKSGTSSEYGNHISGVVDIETKKQIPNKVQGGVGANMTHFDAFLNVPIGKKLGIVVSGRRSFTDFWRSSTFNQLSKKVFQNSVISENSEVSEDSFDSSNNFYFFDINTKVTYNLSQKDVVTFNYLLVRNKLNYFFNTKDSDAYITRDFLKIRNTGWRLKWDHEWSDKVKQTTSFYSSVYDFSYKYEGEFNYNEFYTQNAVKENLIKDHGFKTTIENKIDYKNSLLAGYELVNNNVGYKIHRETTSGSGLAYTIEDSRNNNTHSLYFNYGFNNKNKTIFNLGLRTNYFSLSDKMFLAPRLTFQQQIFPKWFLKSSYEFKQQGISQLIESHTSDFGLENQVWLLIDNKELPILKNHQYTLGALYKSKHTIFDIDFYRKNNEGITSYTRGTVGSVQNLLEGVGHVTGMDLLIKKKFGKYDTWFNYSYSKSTYRFDGANEGKPFPSNFDIRNNFLWAHNLKFGNLSLSLAWFFKNGTPYSKIQHIDNDGTIVLGELNSHRLPNYHRVDFSSSYEFSFDKYKRWKGKIGISLLNIYDRTNILSRRYSVMSSNGNYSIQEIDNLSLGFTPNLVLRVFLK